MAAENVKKEEVSIEEYEAVKNEFKQTQNELEQYKNAFKEQIEKYNSLFGLFANNIDYIIANTKKKEGK